ncbi:hypothetical protein MKD35_264 [Aureococcus anophagefferens virus]|nr:hypothetical protein MKD35_264 [Aureococcus anophagefferens virus]
MSYVPEFVALYEIIPYIEFLPLNNATIRVAVEIYYNFSCLEYIEDEEDEITYNAYKVIIMKYGEIEEWNTSQVTDMSTLFCDLHYFNKMPIGMSDLTPLKETSIDFP